mgnify:CR=1 FL=1
MSQLDENSFGGLMQSRLKGGRVSAKQLALGLNSMPADFINAYILGSVGTTGAITGACASFLYNLQKGSDMITSGRARVVLVGNGEAPITQECIEGYGAMGALATEDGLRQIGGSEEVDFRRASRPFSANCGFTLAESGQFFVLMDDALAMELGADIHGAVPDVFINADGFKKSISAPGPGNYLTMAKAVHAAMQIVGPQAVQQGNPRPARSCAPRLQRASQWLTHQHLRRMRFDPFRHSRVIPVPGATSYSRHAINFLYFPLISFTSSLGSRWQQ